MSKDDNSNLIKLFKLFKNRPNHLVRFLLDNDALNDKFIKNVKNNLKLSKDIQESDLNKSFDSIDDLKDHFSIFVNDIETSKKKKSKNEIIEELNFKIKDAVENENYEEAARIRDYMIRNNLKKNKI
ncbi:MAG TPA: UvrB/UvrC motif-containing protein [Bacilli bacterium]|nr:UvrB/UvrC motif-containing protein [Bacilli bacterium]